MTIKRRGGLRSYGIDGTGVLQINIYSEGKIHAIIDRGWLEHVPFENGKPCESYMIDDVGEILIDASLARKENLHRNDHFYLGSKAKGYVLYINAELEPLGEFQKVYTDSITFTTYARLVIPCVLNRGLGNQEPLESINIVASNRFVQTETSKEKARIRAELEAEGIEIDGYNLGKLLEKYTLTKK